MKPHLAGLASFALLAAPAIARADTTYDWTYTDTGITASGTISVNSSGIADGGTGTISAPGVLVPNPESLSLVTVGNIGSGVYRVGGGTNLSFDNVFNATAPYVDSNGIVFAANGYDATGNGSGFNIWYSGGSLYAGFLGGPASANGTGSGILYTQFDGGSLTVTPAPVPLPGSAWLTLSALAGVLGTALRRQRA